MSHGFVKIVLYRKISGKAKKLNIADVVYSIQISIYNNKPRCRMRSNTGLEIVSTRLEGSSQTWNTILLNAEKYLSSLSDIDFPSYFSGIRTCRRSIGDPPPIIDGL